MAYRDAEGEFFLVDRAADAIETEQGTGYSVFMEEVVLNEVPEVGDVAVVAGRRAGKSVPVAVVTVARAVADPEKLLARANEALRATGHPRSGCWRSSTTRRASRSESPGRSSSGSSGSSTPISTAT